MSTFDASQRWLPRPAGFQSSLSRSSPQACAPLPGLFTNQPQVISGIFFGIAILAAIARTVIRLHLNQRLELDDAFLSLACVCFIATTILLYKMLPDIYLFETLETEPGSVAALIPPVEILQKVVWFENCDSAYLFVTWTAIFLVKASFLAFFRRLINRVGKMVTYWKVVVAITIVVFGFCACIGFIGCPKSGLDAS